MSRLFSVKNGERNEKKLVMTLLELGEHGAALERLDARVEDDPDDAVAWCFRGECLFHLERFREAARSFENGHLLGGPGTEDALVWKAKAEREAGRPETALLTLRRILDDPGGASPDAARQAKALQDELLEAEATAEAEERAAAAAVPPELVEA